MEVPFVKKKIGNRMEKFVLRKQKDTEGKKEKKFGDIY